MAQYTAKYFPDYLKTVTAYKQGQLATSLEESFLGFDATLTQDHVIRQLKILAGAEENEASEEADEEGGLLWVHDDLKRLNLQLA